MGFELWFCSRRRLVSMATFSLLIFIVFEEQSSLLALPNTKTSPVYQTSVKGEYYVIGLFSMRKNNNNSSDFDEKAIRLYVKLRYFIGRQISLIPYFNGVSIGFTAFDVGWDDTHTMTSAVVDILLNAKYRSSETRDSCNCEQDISDKTTKYIVRTEETFNTFNETHQPNYCPARDTTTNNPHNQRSHLPNTTESGNRCCMKSSVFAVVSYMSDELTKLTATILSGEGIPFFAYTEQEVITPFQDNIYHWFFSSFGLLHHDVNTMRSRIQTSVRKNRLVVLLNLMSGTNLISDIHARELWNDLEVSGHCMVSLSSQPRVGNHSRASLTSQQRNVTTIATVVKSLTQNALHLDTSVVWVERKFRSALIRELDNRRDVLSEKRWYVYSDREFVADYTFNVSESTVRRMYLAFVPVYMYQMLNKRFPYTKIRTEVTRTVFKDILQDTWISSYLQKHNLTNSQNPFAWLDDHHGNTVEDESIESLLLPLWWSQPLKRLKNLSVKKMRDFLASLSSSRLSKAEAKSRRYSNVNKKNNYGSAGKKTDALAVISNIQCLKPQCPSGKEPRFVRYTDDPFWSIVKAWRCKRCHVNFNKPVHGNQTCEPCGRDLKSNKARTRCYDPYKELYLTTRIYPGLVVVCLAGIGLFISLFMLVVFCVFRNSSIIRTSSLFTSLSQLVLYAVLFSSILVMFVMVGRPQIGLCALQPVLIGFLMTLIVTLSINKLRQLLSALRAADRVRSLCRDRQHFVSETMELFVLFLLLLVQAILGAVSLVIVQPRVMLKKKTDRFVIDVSCSTELHLDIQLCYVMLLAIYCVIQGYRARKLPKHFNDTQYTAYAMFATVALLAVKFPVTESIEKGVLNRTLANVVAVTLISFAQMVIMFAPKTYIVLFRRQRQQRLKNTKCHFYVLKAANVEVHNTCAWKELQVLEISGVEN